MALGTRVVSWESVYEKKGEKLVDSLVDLIEIDLRPTLSMEYLRPTLLFKEF